MDNAPCDVQIRLNNACLRTSTVSLFGTFIHAAALLQNKSKSFRSSRVIPQKSTGKYSTLFRRAEMLVLSIYSVASNLKLTAKIFVFHRMPGIIRTRQLYGWGKNKRDWYTKSFRSVCLSHYSTPIVICAHSMSFSYRFLGSSLTCTIATIQQQCIYFRSKKAAKKLETRV